jgi:hypothetical protein
LNVTAQSGTNPTLNIFVRYVDPLTGNQVRVQSRGIGTNAGGTFTEGTYTLGDFTQVTNATVLPYTDMRALTSLEMFPDDLILEWVIGGTTPSFTFSISLLGETEAT